jgi:hypothetical protein
MKKIYKLNDNMFSHFIILKSNKSTLNILLFNRNNIINFHEDEHFFNEDMYDKRYFYETTVGINYLKRKNAVEIDSDKFFMKLKLLSIYAYDDIKNKFL